MTTDKKAYLEDDITEADRVVLRLYEEAEEPIEWDESDDAVLAFARSIHDRSESQESETKLETGPAETAEAQPDSEGDSNVVAFAPRRKMSVSRLMHSPVAGFAMAASLMIGVFAGQGLTPYFNLGLAPNYKELIEENDALKEEVELTRSLTQRAGADGQKAVDAGASPDLQSLSSLLGQFECASLSATLTQGLNLSVTGHVGSTTDLQTLSSGLSNLDRAGNVSKNIRVVSWPFCESLEVLATSTEARAVGPASPSIQPYNHGAIYGGGEDLVLEARASNLAGGYLYVDFLQHDGTVLHLLPTAAKSSNKVEAGQSILIGQGEQRYTLVPPFGNEMVMIVQSPVPLFEEERSEVEEATAYLSALRKALKALGEQGYGAELLSSHQFITTQSEPATNVGQQ